MSPAVRQILETKTPSSSTTSRHATVSRATAYPRRAGRAARCRCCSLRSISGEEVRGRISLQNLDRTNAFAENDVRLLTTLAGSLSVALENARLVHETRQRNAELALINSVQDAIAGELEPQAIYDAVGDRIQEIFDAQAVADRDARRGDRAHCTTRTSIERGERLRRSRARRAASRSTCSRRASRC